MADGGLTSGEVAERVRAGAVNVDEDRTSRTIAEIFRANTFTRFNAILGAMLVLILVSGDWADALFGVVLVANTAIGVVQEWRAKRTLDRLAVLSAPRARVVRDGRVCEVPTAEVVLDDLCELAAGDQVVVDGVALESDHLEVDESLLTGESDPVAKRFGDAVLSGSIVVAGRGRLRATGVGRDAYARRLATEARRFDLVDSELRNGIDTILRVVQWALLPTGVLLALSQYRVHEGVREAIAGVVAGVVAMIPEGLVLLTSLAFALAAVTLARRKVLVQELPAVEVLARVDVVLFDKTGTITEGAIGFDELVVLDSTAPVADALGALTDDPNANATARALASEFTSPGWVRTAAVPFSSERKWSAASFAGLGTFVLGAPEVLRPRVSAVDDVARRVAERAGTGRRVLLLAATQAPLPEDASLPGALVPSALVVLAERVRDDAAETLAFFARQGVRCVVISGDNPVTVAAVAARVGVDGAEHPADAREIDAEDPVAMVAALDAHSVFGRATPQFKRAAVHALQGQGRVVAMTGDGVNDALALKDADIGVAMGSGAPATRAVARLVLLDGRFARLPGVVAEGRRVIADIERVAKLFVTKTVYAAFLAIAVGLLRWPYPFLPRQMTVVSSLTIGIPGFFLALAPDRRRYVPGFVHRVAHSAGPAGAVAAGATLVSYAVARASQPALSLDAERTAATLTLLTVGLFVLVLLARPITPGRGALFSVMFGVFVAALVVPGLRDFFAFEVPPWSVVRWSFAAGFGGAFVLEGLWTLRQHRKPPGLRVPRFALRGGGVGP